MVRAAAAALLVGIVASDVSAQQPPTLRLYGTAQVQFNTTSIDADEAGVAVLAPSTFETRRIRPSVEIRYGDHWLARLEPELSMGRAQLRHAYVELVLADAVSLRAGQFKKPFGLIQLTSHTRVPVIERGARIRGLTQALAQDDAAMPDPVLGQLRGSLLVPESQALLDALGYHGYDLGVAAIGRAGPFAVQAGLFNGNGPDQLDDTGAKSWAARMSYAVAPGVTIAASASYRETVRDAAQAAERANGWAWGADLELGELGRPGPSLLFDLATGENYAVDERFIAAHAIGSVYAPAHLGRFEAVEAVARLGFADPRRDIEGDDAFFITPGLNLYLAGRNRVMLNWDVFLPRGERFNTQHALRAQAQLTY